MKYRPALAGFVKAVFIVFALAFTQAGCGSGPESKGSFKAAGNVFPIYDILNNIAGSRAETVLIVSPGASPHTYEASPSDIKRLSGAAAVFTVGAGLDDWAVSVAESASPGIEIYPLHINIELKSVKGGAEHGHGGCSECAHDKDPHYWLSISNARIIAGEIALKLSSLNAENSGYYNENLEKYLEELNHTDKRIRKILEPLNKRKIIVFHDSWNYFASEYGLEIAGVFMISPGIEPGPRSLGGLYSMAAEYGAGAVFSEPQFSAGSLIPFIEDTGLKLGVLDPLGGVPGRESYTAMMLYNAETLREYIGD